ncbi:hypothetical protein NLX83_34270 [Allokutzneria sp. A3M-2-11 16]|uniref:hypothetical protein n=1 Tax=Allokutzneria sp. A3M-2-11 16 TaxID=2962043 RepID=UPI0020B7E93E|nr:hypothetical protein [Allokutzneria sp. A3M-2-11 16]MCP3804345.1 hypothetical protein [Allokutzneria sp. A3M-2-11 16]
MSAPEAPDTISKWVSQAMPDLSRRANSIAGVRRSWFGSARSLTRESGERRRRGKRERSGWSADLPFLRGIQHDQLGLATTGGLDRP